MTMRAWRYQVIARFREAITWSGERPAGTLGPGWPAGLVSGCAAGLACGSAAGFGPDCASSAPARSGTLVTIRANSTRSPSRARPGHVRIDPIDKAYDRDRIPATQRGPTFCDTRACLAPTQPGIERVAQAVAQQVEAEHREHDRRARKAEDPPGTAREVLVRIGEHRAPLGSRWLGAESEE